MRTTPRSNGTSTCAVCHLYYRLISKEDINRINENGIIKETRKTKDYAAYLIATPLHTHHEEQHARDAQESTHIVNLLNDFTASQALRVDSWRGKVENGCEHQANECPNSANKATVAPSRVVSD